MCAAIMMKAALLTGGSLALTATVIGNAYYQKKQFYPSVVYITKSNPSMAVIYIQAFVLVILMGKLMRKVFFGQLRAAELEKLQKVIMHHLYFLLYWVMMVHLIERSWYAVTETCLAFTVFRDDFSPKFVALFTLLLFLKSFHWLADDRVDYMERSPIISLLFHMRVVSLLVVLGSLDAHFVNMAYYSTLTKGASVQLVFGFEYAILLTIVVNIFIKYVLHTIDLQSENPWENKAVYLLYTELIMGFIKVALYMTFMVIMIKIHTFPLFAIRPMYLTLRAFKKALNDVIMSRRAIRNMNTLYPDATPEELTSADNVCIICREEMYSASKKLPCNHIFHTSCLRSWFQRQQTCPTCRMDVLRTSTPAPAAQPQANGQAGNVPQPPQPPPNIPGFFPGAFPGAFPMWPPMQPPPQPPPQTGASNIPSSAGTSSSNATRTGADQTTTNSSGSTTTTSFPAPPPFCFFPPFPFMPHLVPPPRPPPSFSGMTDEEVRALEGQERRNVEARIQCLRNIQTLLDAAVVQMQQYSAVVAALPPQPAPVFPTSNVPQASSKEASASASTSSATESKAAGSDQAAESQPSASQKDSTQIEDLNSLPGGEGSSTNLDEREQLRRRRLQRFADQQAADNNMALD